MFNSNNGYSLADIAAATGGNNNDGFMGGSGAWWIIILFLFVFCGWGGGTWGAGGATGATQNTRDGYVLATDFATIERKIDGVNNGLCDGFYSQAQLTNGVTNTIVTTGNAIQGAIQADTVANMQNTNSLMAKIQDCCCQNERLTMQSNYDAGSRSAVTDNLITTQFANLNYNLADQSCQTRRLVEDTTRNIIDNQNANTRSILDFLTQDKIATLQAENQSLKFAASQAAQNNYLVNTLQPCPQPAYIVCNPYTGQYMNTGCGCNC